MATPAVVTDGVTPISAAYLNKFIAGNGTKTQIKTLYATLIYSSGSLIVDTNHDSCGLVTGDFAYDGTNHYVVLTVSGFTNRPHVQVTPYFTDATYNCKAKAASTTSIQIAFYAVADGSRIAAGSPDANMNFHIEVRGE